PHQCPDNDLTYFDEESVPVDFSVDERCSYCGVPYDEMLKAWDDNRRAIVAFEEFCDEGVTQSAYPNEYNPYAIARRGRGQGDIEMEIIGERERPGREQAAKPPAAPTHESVRAVYESPFDDGVRGVAADRLQEIGDPRGEFIALQTLARPTLRAKERETEL